MLPIEREETRKVLPLSPERKSVDNKKFNSALFFDQLTLRFDVFNLIARITLSYNIRSKYLYVVCITRS